MTGKCRFCSEAIQATFCDLGMSPLSNSYLKHDQLQNMEPFYPLHAYVCGHCYLVQLEEFESPDEIFSDYAYFSSYSDSWLKHAKAYVDYMLDRFDLDTNSTVVELASNDGYLLQYFKEKAIPVLGIEPAENVAREAEKKGIPTLVKFFGVETAKALVAEGKQADLLLGNNVLAHVPDINDFVGGMKILLAPSGIITMEFPHLLQLIKYNQFDTIYHEHFSYLSLSTVRKIFKAHGLTVFDVEELTTHGGSIRIFARHDDHDKYAVRENINKVLDKESAAGIDDMAAYTQFSNQVRAVKNDLLEFVIKAKRQNKSIDGYGAPAKGNTLLNYCGIGNDYIDYTVDRSPHKQDMYLPGTHIPVYAPERIMETRPDFVLAQGGKCRQSI